MTTNAPSLARDFILSLPAGRELDGLVAIHVMGWVSRMPADHPDANELGTWYWVGDNDAVAPVPNWSPSQNIAAAWRVVEKLILNDQFSFAFYLCSYAGCKCQFTNLCSRSTGPATAETAPLAICRAALLAVCVKE